eukprot:752992-Pelagomonas_calceolata.AAC.1
MQPPPATTPLLPQIAHGPVRVPSQALALLQLQPARSQSRVVGPLSRGRAGPAAPQVINRISPVLPSSPCRSCGLHTAKAAAPVPSATAEQVT